MSQQHHHVIVPVKTYVLTLLSLVVLTIFTVVVSRFDFGSLNFAVAMAVALVKASLVALIFMGLKWDAVFNRFILVSCLFFIGLFVMFTMADIKTRAYRDPIEVERIKINSPVKLIQPGQSGHASGHGAGHGSSPSQPSGH